MASITIKAWRTNRLGRSTNGRGKFPGNQSGGNHARNALESSRIAKSRVRWGYGRLSRRMHPQCRCAAGEMVDRQRATQIEGAGKFLRLPPPHLRCQVSGRSKINAASGRRFRRGLSRLPEAHRHQPQRCRDTVDAVAAFGPTARAVVVVDDSAPDAELKRMHGLGARGIRFNLAQAGATTPEMIEPLSKRVNELGWHIQINATPETIMEIMPILEKVPS